MFPALSVDPVDIRRASCKLQEAKRWTAEMLDNTIPMVCYQLLNEVNYSSPGYQVWQPSVSWRSPIIELKRGEHCNFRFYADCTASTVASAVPIVRPIVYSLVDGHSVLVCEEFTCSREDGEQASYASWLSTVTNTSGGGNPKYAIRHGRLNELLIPEGGPIGVKLIFKSSSANQCTLTAVGFELTRTRY